jgi:hypothetical protein
MQKNEVGAAAAPPLEQVDDLTVERYKAPLKAQRAKQDFTPYCNQMRPGVAIVTAASQLIH